MTVRRDRIRASVSPTGANRKIFIYVDKGTGKYGSRHAPYRITARFKPFLRFRTGYSARTQPPVGGSLAKGKVGSGRASSAWVTTKTVLHPGIKPRKFVAGFEKQLQPDFASRINNAFRRAERRVR